MLAKHIPQLARFTAARALSSTAKVPKIALLPGDGVGNEVMDVTMSVLDKMQFKAEYEHGDIGWEVWRHEGDALPPRTIDLLKRTDCALFGAITSMPKEEAEAALIPELKNTGLVYFSPIVRMRQLFNLRTNARPCKAYPGNPLNLQGAEGADIVIFRENTEGMYGGIEFFPMPQKLYDVMDELHPKMKRFASHMPNDIAISTRVMTKTGCRNIITAAFDYAKKKGKTNVTVCDKPNVLRETGGLMIRTAREVAKEYPGIELWETNIDAQCMWLVKDPLNYGVIVAENMFGDILSDLAAQLVGGLGFGCSGNIGDEYAVFEPTHGSAPKYYGQWKVNPMAMLLSARMMLDWLPGEETTKMGDALEAAVAQVILEGKVRTYDMHGTHSTKEVGEEVGNKVVEILGKM